MIFWTHWRAVRQVGEGASKIKECSYFFNQNYPVSAIFFGGKA